MSENNRVCQCCGKILTGLFRECNRKYCSDQCLRNSKHYLNTRQHEQSVFETAMELHWCGAESATIARHLNIPVGTIYSWVHSFGKHIQRIEPLKKQLCLAENADEWLKALRYSTIQNNESFKELPIHLVCRKLHGQSVNKLTAVIIESLKDNPLNGKVYAFCNKCSNTITALSWKEPVFNISKYVKASGTFIWPHEKLGNSIEITKSEFEQLIFLKKHDKISKTLDFMQIL